MTWAEFQIRLHSYVRKDAYDWVKVREVAWTTLIAPYQDPKRLKPLTKEKWMPLLNDKKQNTGYSEEMLKAIKNAKEQYNKEIGQ